MRKKYTAVLLSAVIAAVGTVIVPVAAQAAESVEYEIYPTPHSAEYNDGEYIVKTSVNLVIEDGIDEAAEDRLEEVLALKSEITDVKISDGIQSESTNILVGIHGSGGYADNYAKEEIETKQSGLYDKADAYMLDSSDGVITVVGKDADAAFYGLTTLYHIFRQMDSYTIRNFHIEDYADVVSRGFIEGYYGNPWSTEDRVKLMEWGGYYKLNSYFYAPKDDPKHNAQWRSLYTEEELKEKIVPLAEAGNRSKCRFVYALHPFMNDPIDFGSGYEEDFEALTDKFGQVIDSGVRQIAVLADDAGKKTEENYTRLLTDLTEWLKEKQKEYPELKLTLPFVPQEYGGKGETYFKNFPENVQVVMTGGRVWGEVSEDFTASFYNKVGRGAYMWINWPCTDNSKKHLIMGGYTTFLHPGTDPGKIQGIILNPMQQSEPSKIAIFGNADYSWNVWETEADGQQAWEASFKYADHNSAEETAASDALKELSKHMINQDMDSRVAVLEESVELSEKLDTLKEKMNQDAYTKEDVEAVAEEFEILQQAADTYEEQASDTRVRDQIVYWLDCWDDTTDAALAFLNAMEARLDNDSSTLISEYTEGQSAFARSKKHGFDYMGETQYAEVGVQHIVPFIESMEEYLASKVQEAADPTVVNSYWISDVFEKAHSGSAQDVFDGDDSTAISFHSPDVVNEGNWFGARFSQPVDVDSIRILMGGGKNHFYHSKLQYLPEGADETDGWQDVNGETYERPKDSEEAVTATDTGLKNVRAIRLIATEANKTAGTDTLEGCWLNVKSIDVNTLESGEFGGRYKVSAVTLSDNLKISQDGGSTDNILDGDLSTELWVQNSTGADNTPADAAVTLDLGEEKTVGAVYVAQDTARTKQATDVLSDGVVEYSTDGSKWTEYGSLLADQNQQTLAKTDVKARYIRVRNETQKGIWWRLSELQVYEKQDDLPLVLTASGVDTKIGEHQNVNADSSNNRYAYITDGDGETLAWLQDEEASSTNIQSGSGVELAFSRSTPVDQLTIRQGNSSNGDMVTKLKVEYRPAGENDWKNLTVVENAGRDVTVSAGGVKADGIRLTSIENLDCWWQLYEVSVVEGTGESALYTNVAAPGFTAQAGEESAGLTGDRISLGAGGYVGIDFGGIRKIASVAAEYTATDGVKCEYSQNGKTWEEYAVSSGGQAEDAARARYIRIVNRGSDETTLDSVSLTVQFETVGELGELVKADIEDKGWQDTRNNGAAFDGDMTTTTKFGGPSSANDEIIYSLGQEVTLHSLRIYTQDDVNYYLRDAEVYGSTDKENWTKLFTVGDGAADSGAAADNTMAENGAGQTDSNYPNVRYYGEDNLNGGDGVKARYLKIRITAYHSHAILMNEIVINGGAYISPEDNAAFSGTPEEKGHAPGNMLDKDLTTTYRPSEKNGALTYSVSDGTDAASFRIIQSGRASGVRVKASLYPEDVSRKALRQSDIEIKEVGALSQAVNTFKVPEGYTLLAITIEWGEELPDIAELILLDEKHTDTAAVNKEELTSLVNSTPEGYDGWTEASKKAYGEMKDIAKELLTNDYVTQATIDSAAAGLQKAISSAETKAAETELDALKALVTELQSMKETDYTAKTWNTYSQAVKSIESALKGEVTQEQAQELKTAAETAKAALTYSIRERELAETETESFAAFVKDSYTTDSYTAFENAKKAVEDLVSKDKAAEENKDRVPPAEMKKAREAYVSAQQGLVDVTALKAAIAEFGRTVEALYTEQSYGAYKKAVEEAKKELASGTADSVKAAFEAITEARYALEYKEEAELEQVIAEAEALSKENYTEASYAKLQKAVEDAKKYDGEDTAVMKQHIEAIGSAKRELVDIAALKAKTEEAKAVDKERYTVSSYEKLETLIAEAEALYKEGTQTETDRVKEELTDMLTRGLKLRAAGMEAYREELKPETAEGWTEDSYQAYKAAYDALMAADPEDTDEETFQTLKAAYEKAKAELEAEGGGQKPDGDQNPDGGKTPDDNNSKSDNDKQSGGTAQAVKTGDDSSVVFPIMALAASALAAGGSAYIVKRSKSGRKRKE